MSIFRIFKKPPAPPFSPPPPRRVENFGNLRGGELGFVAVYYNACGYQRRRDNMFAFLHRWKWMEDRLLVVELAYGDKPFELSGKFTNLLQLRTDSVLWHKENLINLGTQILRDRGFENVGWLDGDTEILGDGEAWYNQCCKILKRRHLVQCFERAEHHYDERTLRRLGAAAEYLESGRDPLKCYQSGLAWAVRGAVWDACGWYDLSIWGGGDRLAYFAALPTARAAPADAENIMQFCGPRMLPYKRAWREWAENWRRLVDGRLDYVPGVTIRGHPHGNRADRNYHPREIRIQEIGFDPGRDVRRDENGVLEWTAEAPLALPKYIGKYFRSRREDGRLMTRFLSRCSSAAACFPKSGWWTGAGGEEGQPPPPSPPPPRRVESYGNLHGGELGFVAVYYNACGYRRLRDNILAFLHRWKWMEDRLLVVELAYGDKPFELSGKFANLLQLRTDSVLWHKENLINLGTQILRDRGFENVGWLDGDTEILGDGEAWYNQCRNILKRRHLVQCFERIEHHYDELIFRGLGSAAEYLKPGSDPLKCYKAGGAWAVRGAIWDACGWYDLNIWGSGDFLAYIAALPTARVAPADAENITQFRRPQMLPHKLAWREWAGKWRRLVDGRLDHVPGVTMRAYAHGNRADRNYHPRNLRIREIGFDPARDVRRDENGVLEWTAEAPPALSKYIGKYFRNRREDGSRFRRLLRSAMK